jgi:hypothetical protein
LLFGSDGVRARGGVGEFGLEELAQLADGFEVGAGHQRDGADTQEGDLLG